MANKNPQHKTKSKRSVKKKMGRPSVYRPDADPQAVRKMLADGKTIEECAAYLKISKSTLYEWIKEHAEFSNAVDEGQEAAINQVEKSLFQRATGYSVKAEKLIVVSQGKDGSEVERHSLVEHYPPDTNAAKFFLINRRGKKWKDKQVIEHSGTAELAKKLAAARERVKNK